MAKRPPKAPPGDKPDDDLPPAFLGIDTQAIAAAEPAQQAAFEADKAEKAPPQAGKLPRHIEKALRERDALNAMPAATAVVVPMGRAMKGRKPLTKDQIKEKAAAAEARSKGANPKAGKVFEFVKGGTTIDPKATPRAKARKAYVEAPFGATPMPPEKLPVKPKKAAPAAPRAPRAPRADHVALTDAAARGKLPPVHHNIYTAPTHKGYVKRMKAAEEAAKKGDIAALKAMRAEKFWDINSSSRVIIRRWMDNAIIALTYRPRGASK